jgi:hypothetical protein
VADVSAVSAAVGALTGGLGARRLRPAVVTLMGVSGFGVAPWVVTARPMATPQESDEERLSYLLGIREAYLVLAEEGDENAARVVEVVEAIIAKTEARLRT